MAEGFFDLALDEFIWSLLLSAGRFPL